MNEPISTGDESKDSIPKAPECPPILPLYTILKTANDNSYDNPSEDLDMVKPNLYIGCLEAANNVDNLKKLNISHILTVEDYPIQPANQKHFTYKFKKLSDHPHSDILDMFDECIEFIDSAIQNNTGILIHCLMGLSRSASILIAYLLKKDKKTLKETLQFVRQYRYIRPNPGFLKQLAFYEKMDCSLDKNSSAYKAYKLERLAELINMGGRFEKIYDENFLFQNNEENAPCFKCKKCRFKLFNKSQVIGHVKGFEIKDKKNWDSKLNYYCEISSKIDKNGEADGECNLELFIEPLIWFKEKLSNLNGKLNCPKCDTKLGSFDWCGSKCSCGAWVTPAFHISGSKVDFCQVSDIDSIISNPK